VRCKDNAAMNSVTVNHKRTSLPSNFTGHAALEHFSIELKMGYDNLNSFEITYSGCVS
jgi:hypothetical protein